MKGKNFGEKFSGTPGGEEEIGKSGEASKSGKMKGKIFAKKNFREHVAERKRCVKGRRIKSGNVKEEEESFRRKNFFGKIFQKSVGKRR